MTGRWASGYTTMHRWVKKNYPKPNNCEQCGESKRLDLAFKNHSAGLKTPELYTDDIKDWIWLCRTCHMKQDGRVKSIRPKFCSCGKEIKTNKYGSFHIGGGKSCEKFEVDSQETKPVKVHEPEFSNAMDEKQGSFIRDKTPDTFSSIIADIQQGDFTPLEKQIRIFYVRKAQKLVEDAINKMESKYWFDEEDSSTIPYPLREHTEMWEELKKELGFI